jgi:hypothetical protein
VVPVKKVEEAIQRQVVSGGDLEDVLLEMGLVDENVLAAYRAALFGLLPATRDEVMKVPRELVKLVPRDAATQYGLVPLAREGRTLVVAAASPLTIEQDAELSFLLGCDLVYRIATSVRMAAALAHHYGLEIPPNKRALADKLRDRPAGRVPFVKPPQDNKVDASALGLPKKKTELSLEEETDTHPMLPASGKRNTARAPGAGVGVARVVNVSGRPSSPGEVSAPSAPPREVAPKAEAESTPSIAASIGSALASGTARDSEPESRSRVRRLRGPMTAKTAVEALAQVQDRDEVLEVFFAFIRQFFDYSALFVVQGGHAVGRASYGPGATIDEVREIAVPLDPSGTFGAVRKSQTPRVNDLNKNELDAIVARELERDRAQPALVAPVTIRDRVILIVYGDRAGEPFTVADVPELTAILPRVADAFERIIVKRKFKGYAPSAGEDRGSLKAAAQRATAQTARDDEPPIAPYRTSDRPARRSSGRHRVGPLGVLGVPRSAPPPPMTDADAPVPGREAVARALPPEPPPSALEAALREADEAAGLEDAEPGDEVTIDYEAEEPRSSETPSVKPVLDPAASSYRAQNVSEEVFGSERRARRSRPARRPDGRIRATSSSPPASPEARRPRSIPPATPAARRPRKVQASGEPSVIVDMGENVEALVDQLMDSGPEDDGPAVLALVNLGEVALPAITQRFPGPLWFDRSRPHRRLPRGRDVSAIARAIVAFGERAVPYVASLLSSRDADSRFYATLVASEFVAPELMVPLSERIFDDDAGTQVLALDVLKRYSRHTAELEEILKGLRVEARVGTRSHVRRRVAARALGELRDQKALELLIDLLATSEPELVSAAHRALVTLTRQDFGDSMRRWQAWAERNSERHRIEWLIDGLLHNEETIRAAAADELKTLTQEYFGYHPASPKKDREIAQRKYRAWWESDGRRRFGS